MATKTITIELDVYEALATQKWPKESFSELLRRLLAERPATTAAELLAVMRTFVHVGAGARR
jgi:predicted CopG family antitoxin